MSQLNTFMLQNALADEENKRDYRKKKALLASKKRADSELLAQEGDQALARGAQQIGGQQALQSQRGDQEAAQIQQKGGIESILAAQKAVQDRQAAYEDWQQKLQTGDIQNGYQAERDYRLADIDARRSLDTFHQQRTLQGDQFAHADVTQDVQQAHELHKLGISHEQAMELANQGYQHQDITQMVGLAGQQALQGQSQDFQGQQQDRLFGQQTALARQQFGQQSQLEEQKFGQQTQLEDQKFGNQAAKDLYDQGMKQQNYQQLDRTRIQIHEQEVEKSKLDIILKGLNDGKWELSPAAWQSLAAESAKQVAITHSQDMEPEEQQRQLEASHARYNATVQTAKPKVIQPKTPNEIWNGSGMWADPKTGQPVPPNSPGSVFLTQRQRKDGGIEWLDPFEKHKELELKRLEVEGRLNKPEKPKDDKSDMSNRPHYLEQFGKFRKEIIDDRNSESKLTGQPGKLPTDNEVHRLMAERGLNMTPVIQQHLGNIESEMQRIQHRYGAIDRLPPEILDQYKKLHGQREEIMDMAGQR